VPERRLRGDDAECPENILHERQGETAQQHGAGRHYFVLWRLGEAGGAEQVRH
jgi:hypothetical protein